MKPNHDLSISLAVTIATQAYFEQATPEAYKGTFIPMGKDERAQLTAVKFTN